VCKKEKDDDDDESTCVCVKGGREGGKDERGAPCFVKINECMLYAFKPTYKEKV